MANDRKYQPEGSHYGAMSPAHTPTRELFDRARLTQNLYPCSQATALLQYSNPNLDHIDGTAITIVDPLATVNFMLAADIDDDENFFLPAGTCLYVRAFDDTNYYEPVGNPGTCCISGSEESESSESEESESEESESEESESEESESSEESSESESEESSCDDPNVLPDGTCPHWIKFTDCDGGNHFYWGN